MVPKIENLKGVSDLGEAPHWDASTKSLYFVDIAGKTINRYVPATGKYTQAKTGNCQPSLIIPIEGEKNKFVISLSRELVIIFWDGESADFEILEKLPSIDNDPHLSFNRVNDGKCDPKGRLWAGTMSSRPSGPFLFPKSGTLYSFSSKKECKSHKTDISISNGLAWNEKDNTFFFIDSATCTVEKYDYDIQKGSISNGTIWFSIKKHGLNECLPDGMTIDSDGNLYVATCNGGLVLKIDGHKPETLLTTIDLPPVHVTSLAFGGKNYDELYVTTAYFGDEAKKPEIDGCLYRITGLDAKGLPGVNFKL